MGIVSISLNDENLAALDQIQAAYGLSGRSEAVRTAINAATIEMQDLADLTGEVEGVLIIIKRDHADPWVDLIQAKHVACIKTQLHSHLRNRKCLEVMVVACEAADLRAMLHEIHAAGKADYVRFVRS